MANGPVERNRDSPCAVQVMNPSTRPVRLPVEAVVASISHFEGPTLSVSSEQMKTLAQGPPKKLEEAHMEVDLGEVPEAL